MLLSVYIFLGLLAVGATTATFANLDQTTRMLTALFATISWGLWAVHSFDVETTSSGVGFTFSYFSLAILGIAAAAIMLLTSMRLAFELISGESGTENRFDPNAR